MYFNSRQKGNQEQNIHDKRAIKNKILFNMYFNSGQKGNQEQNTV